MSQKSQSKKTNYHRHRDEIKRHKALEAKRSKFSNNVNNLTKDILEETFFIKPSRIYYFEIFVEVVSNNLTKFHLETNSSTIEHK